MNIESIPKHRIWIYRILAIVFVPVTFLLCLEGSLRLFDVGQSLSFTKNCTVNDQAYLCNNPKFIELFFPKDLARQPADFAYPQKKPDGTFRIFVLGASAAQGDPDYSYGFSRILEVLLRKRYPAINFEIINSSITATNSHVVLQVAKELSHHQPDLAIIYLGNNEVVGPFGAGTIFSPISPNLSLIRAGIQLRTTRIGQLMNNFVRHVTDTKNPKQWHGMEMFTANEVPSETLELQTVYHHFQKNLQDIIQTFRETGAPVIVSTVGSNLKDFPPLASQHKPSLPEDTLREWETVYSLGQRHITMGETDAALSAFLKAAEIDDSYADLQFHLGQCYLELGLPAAARKHFVRARDLDTLRFRADSQINGIIRTTFEKSADKGVFLVDAVHEFNEQSPHKIQGKEIFYEHVHMTFKGNYILALELAKRIQQFLSSDSKFDAENAEFLSEEECSRLLALSQFDRLRIKNLIFSRMTSPPFTNQINHIEEVKRLQQEYKELEKSVTPQSIATDENLYSQVIQAGNDDAWLHINYGFYLKENKQLVAAIKQFQIAEKLLPGSYKVQRYLADSYMNSGQFRKALPHLVTSIMMTNVTSDRTKLQIMLAYAQATMERYEESMMTYRAALAEDPDSASIIYHAMAKLKINTGNLREARELLEKAIDHSIMNQGTGDLYFNYGHVLKQLGNSGEAEAAYRKAQSNYLEAQSKASGEDREALFVVLGRTSFEIGEIDQGVDYLQHAIDMNPTELNHHLTLITALARNQHFDEACFFLEKALKVMRESGKAEALQRLEGIKASLAKSAH